MRGIIAIYMALYAIPAHAQECAGYADVVAGLNGRWQEELAIRGQNPDGTTSEVWGNSTTGSWTYIITRPDGLTCLIASGAGFERHNAKPNT